MRRTPLAVWLAVALLPSVAGAQDARAANVTVDVEQVKRIFERRARPLRFVPGEVIVKPKGAVLGPLTVQDQLLDPVRDASGGAKVYRIRGLDVLSGDAERKTQQVAMELRSKPSIEYADLNYIFHIAQQPPDDPLFGQQWVYRAYGTGKQESAGALGILPAWKLTQGSHDVVVAVLDTGLVAKHPDMTDANLVAGYDFISDAFFANENDKTGESHRDADASDPGDATSDNECFPGDTASPASWHGSHVAGIVGAGITGNKVGIAGVNWKVRIQPVRVLGKCGGTMSDINDAIRWAAGLAVDKMPANKTPARIINLSLGGAVACQASTQEAISAAVKEGAIVVVAAGNEAMDAGKTSPAGCKDVFTVAASDARGHLVNRYSNWGDAVDIMAPGGDVDADLDKDKVPDGILSLVKDGYAVYNGTSMAAPQVAGAAALILARHPALKAQEVLDRLTKTARKRTSSQCKNKCGAGLLDVGAAIQ